jgi:site-specific DNA-cytosine methylase
VTIQGVDVEGFAGGFTEGARQAGVEVVAKRELPGGFGAPSVLRNFPGIDYEESDHREWTAKDVPFVFGNPPCSGFSVLSSIAFRGAGSPINSCMWALVEYAAKCNPDIVAFESVQLAFTTGRSLMQALRDDMERRTGEQYDLHHVLHNGYALGGPANRRRYFFVLSRIPFGLEPPEITAVPVLWDVIGDLATVSTDDAQAHLVHTPPSWWHVQEGIRREDGLVDGHIALTRTPNMLRVRALLDGVEWHEGMNLYDVAKAYHAVHGRLPGNVDEEMAYRWLNKSSEFAINKTKRWRADRAGRVITGSSVEMALHPMLPRCLSLRECYRLQGFPDSWQMDFVDDYKNRNFYKWPGKGIPVQAGRWISGWVKQAVNGNPGGWIGELIGEREWVTNSTADHQRVYHERTGARGADARSATTRKLHGARVMQRREVTVD